jgi:hypothetical protein
MAYKRTRPLQSFRFFSEIELFNVNEPAPALTIKRQFAFLKASFEITLPGHIALAFTTQSIWRLHYLCTHGAMCMIFTAIKGASTQYLNGRQ